MSKICFFEKVLDSISHDSCGFQLFRRVAAALPGMEQTEQKKTDNNSILSKFSIIVSRFLADGLLNSVRFSNI